MELRCADCDRTMERLERGEVKYWRCACGGHVMAVSSVRRMLPEGMWGEVWPILRDAARPGARTCPACNHRMEQSKALEKVGGHALDICDRCRILWFDPGEYEAMPKRDVPPGLPLEQRQAIGRAMAAAMNLEYDLRRDSIGAAFAEALRRALESMGRLRLH
jgi:Zn-finger nucleic acid-binding protein